MGIFKALKAMAQDRQRVNWGTFFNPQDQPGNGWTWQTLIDNVINIMLMVAGAVAVIYLIYSGIIYITAGGNPEQAKKGQQGVINAVIGIVIIMAVYLIIRAAVGVSGILRNDNI